jgi:glycine/D-amino acid oxidase-like deaminating enzyme
MSKLVYEVVQHDGGWAYKADGVFSESFATHDLAAQAAHAAASKQQRSAETEVIEYQDRKGEWHTETAKGNDRPETSVRD